MATFSQPTRSKAPAGLWPALLLVTVLGLGAASLFLMRSSRANEVDKATGCLMRGEAPAAALFLVDITDHLSKADIGMIAGVIADRSRALPRASRMIVVPFGDDISSAFVPLDIPCTKPRGEAARLDENSRFLDEDYKKYQADLVAKIEAAIAAAPATRTSPITDQVTRAASSPSLHWQGQSRELTLFSDGLQTGAAGRTGRGFRLPEPAGRMLDGVDATFVEIGNRRDHRLQTRREREAWHDWLSSAGAQPVRMVAPGYAPTPRAREE